MELLQAGVDHSVIVLWLGHEFAETTMIYLQADLTFKEKILDRTKPSNVKAGRYRPSDKLLQFLTGLLNHNRHAELNMNKSFEFQGEI